MKLSVWAKKQCVCYRTAFQWFKDGKIKNSFQTESGSIFVEDDVKNVNVQNNCIYARVSNQSRKSELEFQVDRLNQFCSANGIVVHKIYKEVASGMNDKRKELAKMLNSNPTKIIVENKDRLTRFGFNYLELLLNKNQQEIVVVNRAMEDKQDLLQDLTSVIYSFCARIYGLRRVKNKLDKIKDIIVND
jgi:predicted site-specific integrase-resolvase